MVGYTFNPFTGNLDAISVEDLSGYVPYVGATQNLDLGSYKYRQDQSVAGGNYLGLTYLRGMKVTNAIGVGGGGYFTFSSTDDLGTLSMETTAGSYIGNSVEMRFDLTDQKIHLDNPIIIDSSVNPSISPAIQISNGADILTLNGKTITTTDGSDSVIINPTEITGSPTIVMDKAEQDTNVLEVHDNVSTPLDGTALYLDSFPDKLYGISTYWLSDVRVGDVLSFNSTLFTVISIQSDIELTADSLTFFGDQGPFTVYREEATTLIINSDGFIESNFQPAFNEMYSNGTYRRRWDKVYTKYINDNLVITFEDAYDHSLLVSGNPHNVTSDDVDCPTKAEWKQNGFENTTDSTISFTDGTRTFSIQPTSTNFNYWVEGVKYTSTGDTVVIDDTEGIWIIYYDDDTLTAVNNPAGHQVDSIIRTKAIVSIIYWNSTDNEAIYVGEERHGKDMSPSTHAYLHFVNGLEYLSGLGLNTINADGTGVTADAQFGIDAGGVTDEDLYNSISAVTSTTGLPIYYMMGSTPTWNKYVESGFSMRTLDGTVNDRLAYNQYTGGAWQLTEVANNDFVLCHVFATTEKDNPMIAVIGQNDYATKKLARAGALTEIKSLVTNEILFPEIRAIATVIFQTNTGYASAINAKIVSTDEGDDYIDWRSESISRTEISTSDHGSLTGLGDDDHTQYLLADGTRALTGTWTTGMQDIIASKIGFCGTTPSYCIDVVDTTFTDSRVFNVELNSSNTTTIAMNFDVEFNSSLADTGTAALRPIQGVVNTQKDRSGTQQLEGSYFKIGDSSVAQTQGTRNLKGVSVDTYTNNGSGGTQNISGVEINPQQMIVVTGTGDVNNKGIDINRSTTVYNGGSGTINSYGIELSGYTPGVFDDEIYAIKVVDGDVYFPDDITDGTNTVTVANMKSAYDHVSNNGSDHSYIDQDVTSGATPTFGDIKGETKCWDVTVTKPGDFYSIDTQIPVGYTKSALTITKIVVSTNTTSYEVAGDLKWADNLTAFTNATVINDFDTTSGVRTDSTITAGSVAASKYVYLQLDSAPDAAVTWMNIHVEWDYD